MTYTDQKVFHFLSKERTQPPTGRWLKGKFYTGFKDQSKTKYAVKANSLIRLAARLRNR